MSKIKTWIQSEQGKDILIVLIVILVGLGSFELGRLSKSGRSPGIKIKYPDQVTNQPANAFSASSDASYNDPESASANTGSFFASKRGKKYYPLGCPAGSTLKEENKIWFETREEAEATGYELSSSCE